MRIKGTAFASLGIGLVICLIVWNAPNYFWVWIWGPDTGYRAAGLSSGHYERRFPAILRGGPTIGVAFVGAGERLVIDYDLTLHEGGASFRLWKLPILVHRARHVGPRKIVASGPGRIEVPIDSAGFYEIAMYAYRIQGEVTVDWRTEDPADAGGRVALGD